MDANVDRGLLRVEVEADADVDDEEFAELTARLRQRLLDLDVDEVSPVVAGDAPYGAKGLELVSIGALVVQFALRPDVLRGIVTTVRSWLSRQPVRSIELALDGDTCKVTGVSSAEQEKLIDLWISRHAQPD